MKAFKTRSRTFTHHMLSLLCFMGSKPAVSRRRFHHSVMTFGRVSAWVSGWYLTVGDHKKNYCPGVQPRRPFFTTQRCVFTAPAVPCHIWRLSQPAPGQVSPPRPARYQTLGSKHKRETERISAGTLQNTLYQLCGVVLDFYSQVCSCSWSKPIKGIVQRAEWAVRKNGYTHACVVVISSFR